MNRLLLFILSCSFWSGVAVSGKSPALNYKAVHNAAPVKVDETLGAARKRFIAEVTNGHFKEFDDEHGQVAFKTSEKDDSAHRPGPMEDDVIASTLRSHIAGDADLQKAGLKIRSEAGRIQFNGAPDDPKALAKLIVLALGIDGVTGVRADLPPVLRAKI